MISALSPATTKWCTISSSLLAWNISRRSTSTTPEVIIVITISILVSFFFLFNKLGLLARKLPKRSSHIQKNIWNVALFLTELVSFLMLCGHSWTWPQLQNQSDPWLKFTSEPTVEFNSMTWFLPFKVVWRSLQWSYCDTTWCYKNGIIGRFLYETGISSLVSVQGWKNLGFSCKK